MILAGAVEAKATEKQPQGAANCFQRSLSYSLTRLVAKQLNLNKQDIN